VGDKHVAASAIPVQIPSLTINGLSDTFMTSIAAYLSSAGSNVRAVNTPGGHGFCLYQPVALWCSKIDVRHIYWYICLHVWRNDYLFSHVDPAHSGSRMQRTQRNRLTVYQQHFLLEIPLTLVDGEPVIAEYQFVDVVGYQKLRYQSLASDVVSQTHRSQHADFCTVRSPQLGVSSCQVGRSSRSADAPTTRT